MSHDEALELVKTFCENFMNISDSKVESVVKALNLFATDVSVFHNEIDTTKLVASGVLDHLFFIIDLSRQNPNLVHDDNIETVQKAALACIAAIAANFGQTHIMSYPKALDILAYTLHQSPFQSMRTSTVLLLGNLCEKKNDDGAATNCQQICLHEEVVDGVLCMIEKHRNSEQMKYSLSTLSNMLQEKSSLAEDKVFVIAAKLMDILHLRLMKLDKKDYLDLAEILEFILFSICLIMSEGEAEKQLIGLTKNFIPSLFASIRWGRSTNHKSVVTRAMRCVNELVTGGEILQQKLIENNFFLEAKMLLQKQNRNFNEQVCWGLAKMTETGDSGRLEKFRRTRELLQSVIAVADGGSLRAQERAANVLCNFVYGADRVGHKWFLAKGGLRALCDLIQISGDSNTHLCERILDTIQFLLEMDYKNNSKLKIRQLVDNYGGVRSLESLLDCVNIDVYGKAVRILDDYYNENQSDDEYMVDSEESEDEAGDSYDDSGSLFSPKKLEAGDPYDDGSSVFSPKKLESGIRSMGSGLQSSQKKLQSDSHSIGSELKSSPNKLNMDTPRVQSELQSSPAKLSTGTLCVGSGLKSSPAKRNTGTPCVDSELKSSPAKRNTGTPCVDSELESSPAKQNTGTPCVDSGLESSPAKRNTGSPCVDSGLESSPKKLNTGSPCVDSGLELSPKKLERGTHSTDNGWKVDNSGKSSPNKIPLSETRDENME